MFPMVLRMDLVLSMENYKVMKILRSSSQTWVMYGDKDSLTYTSKWRIWESDCLLLYYSVEKNHKTIPFNYDQGQRKRRATCVAQCCGQAEHRDVGISQSSWLIVPQGFFLLASDDPLLFLCLCFFACERQRGARQRQEKCLCVLWGKWHEVL